MTPLLSLLPGKNPGEGWHATSARAPAARSHDLRSVRRVDHARGEFASRGLTSAVTQLLLATQDWKCSTMTLGTLRLEGSGKMHAGHACRCE